MSNELAIILMVAHKATQPIDGFTGVILDTRDWVLEVDGGLCTLRRKFVGYVVQKVDYNTLQEWVREESVGVVD